MSAARSIVSFLPSATEMACALGLGDQLMGVSHECDYPPETKDKPIVVRSVLPIERMSQREIDSAVAERLRNGLSLYQVDESLMRAIAPDLILTQDLCQVCAPSGNEVARLLQVLPSKPQVLFLTPKCIEQIFDNLRELGAATGRFRRRLLPIGPADFIRDLRAALSGRLTHDDLSVYNAVQKALYLGVLAAGVVMVLSGLAIWKPGQLQELAWLFGGFDTARLVHFLGMATIVLFLLVHVALVLIVPKTLPTMITGRAALHVDEPHRI